MRMWLRRTRSSKAPMPEVTERVDRLVAMEDTMEVMAVEAKVAVKTAKVAEVQRGALVG